VALTLAAAEQLAASKEMEVRAALVTGGGGGRPLPRAAPCQADPVAHLVVTRQAVTTAPARPPARPPARAGVRHHAAARAAPRCWPAARLPLAAAPSMSAADAALRPFVLLQELRTEVRSLRTEADGLRAALEAAKVTADAAAAEQLAARQELAKLQASSKVGAPADSWGMLGCHRPADLCPPAL